MLEMGNKIPEGKIFALNTLKRAIREVSKTKFERTLIAENPDFTENFQKFRDTSPKVTADWIQSTLRDRNGQKIEDVDYLANGLSDIGFLKRIGAGQWWIPYLYQYALGIAPEEQ